MPHPFLSDPGRTAAEEANRPFPWPCVNRFKEEVSPETISYTANMKHDGRLQQIEIPVVTPTAFQPELALSR